MSEVPPIGLATNYQLLLPVLSPNCTVYNHLPFCIRTYSQAPLAEIEAPATGSPPLPRSGTCIGEYNFL